MWIDCDPAVRAERVAEREGVTVARARADNDERQAVERARYLALYGLDLADLSIYDLVLDSGALGAGEWPTASSAAPALKPRVRPPSVADAWPDGDSPPAAPTVALSVDLPTGCPRCAPPWLHAKTR